MTVDARAFVDALVQDLQGVLARLGQAAGGAAPAAGPTVPELLKVALKNELDAADLAGRWIPTTPHLDIKLALARQAGDEARHYALIETRLRALGVSLAGFDPVGQGYGPLFQWLVTLTDPVERVAAGQFAQEAIAVVKNEAFIGHCAQVGDHETARLYRDAIQGDERRHHEAGLELLRTHAVTPEAQARARAAVQKTLDLAEELQGLARKTLGVCHLPGC